jgi:sialate O-acetylesterase
MADPFEPLPVRPPSEQNSASESYIQMLRYPNTAMVITSDLGSGNHPKNKSGYGTRAARVALGAVYGKKIEYYGPMYDSHKIDGDHVRITFRHVGAGLAFANSEKLQGFFVAGEDKVFYWADAAIDGNEVVLTCPKVPHPIAVRYGWAWRYRWANLFNKDGLPAIPFRTDSW